MTVLAGINQNFGCIIGRITASGGATGVIGGTMTAGTFDSAGSGLITFAPAFKAVPTILATYQGFAANTANITAVQLSGAGVSNVYVSIGTTPASGGIISLAAFGLQAL